MNEPEFQLGDRVEHTSGLHGKVVGFVPTRPDLPLVKWDGRKRSEPAWPKDLEMETNK